MVLLVLPMAGLAYIVYRVARTTFRRAVLATRGHPALRSLGAAGVLVAAAGLTVHWGVLPLRGRRPGPSVAGQPGQLTGQLTASGRIGRRYPAAGLAAGSAGRAPCSNGSARSGSTRWKPSAGGRAQA